MQYNSTKYGKLINDVRVYLVNEFKIKLEDKFEPLINELKLDSTLMDEMDDIFRRNGYNRKHAYGALFDDSEEVDGESPLRIESPGSWNR